jgi:hypothetical protein
MINKSGAMAVYLEVGSRHARRPYHLLRHRHDEPNADGRFVHKDGTPYPEP